MIKLPPFYQVLANHLSITKSVIIGQQQCLLCHQPNNQRLCKQCQLYLQQAKYSCQRCALPLDHFATECGACMQKPPYFDEVISPFIYEYPLNDLIYRFKNTADMKTGKALSELFLKSLQRHYLQQHLPWPDYVVPVPLDWRKQWQRGFNQSFVLGETIVKAQNLKWFLDVKRRGSRNKIKDQKRLSRRNRQKNVKNSFEVKQKLHGESLAIIDDVMTTGTTVNSFAKALKAAGAGKISVWALARTPLH